MPSILHEGILELIRERPAFAAELLRRLLGIAVPDFTEARLAEATLNDVIPTEYRADQVVLFAAERPVFCCVIEAQLSENPRKRWAWPVYGTTARAKYECPCVVVVITPDDAVAKWASVAVDLGGGQFFRPLVIGPTGIPVITDAEEAKKDPSLALLSAMAHARGNEKIALDVALAALSALATTQPEQQVIYFHLLRATVGNAARKVFEMLPQHLEKYLTEDERQRMRDAVQRGLQQGLQQGVGSALLTVLESRNIAVPESVRARIATATATELQSLLQRAAFVTTAEELFD